MSIHTITTDVRNPVVPVSDNYFIARNTEALKMSDHCWACGFTYEEYFDAVFNKGYRTLTFDQYYDRCRINNKRMHTAMVATNTGPFIETEDPEFKLY